MQDLDRIMKRKINTIGEDRTSKSEHRIIISEQTIRRSQSFWSCCLKKKKRTKVNGGKRIAFIG